MPSEATTVVVRRNITPGYVAQFDDWLRRFIEVERRTPGYLGTTVIVPEGSETVRYIVHRFESEAASQRWENDPERLAMLAEANRYSTPLLDRQTGLETWFKIPGIPSVLAPPRWKMALVLLAGATLISVTARYLIGGYLATLPVPLAAFLMSAILVVFLTWVVMPNFTRWLRPWLYPITGNPTAPASS